MPNLVDHVSHEEEKRFDKKIASIFLLFFTKRFLRRVMGFYHTRTTKSYRRRCFLVGSRGTTGSTRSNHDGYDLRERFPRMRSVNRVPFHPFLFLFSRSSPVREIRNKRRRVTPSKSKNEGYFGWQKKGRERG